MNRDERPIGVFDSGVGGLTVMRELVEVLPNEHMIYLGDTARVPYGNRGADTVRQYALNASRVLLNREVKALVVACNTASAHAIDALRERLDVPVIDVIEPVARRATDLSEDGAIGMIGTRGTVASNCYRDSIKSIDPQRPVIQVACPLLVPLAEEGWTSGSVTNQVTEHYLSEFSNTSIASLILGCTHYPILRNTLEEVTRSVIPSEPQLVDSASATAEATAETLQTAGIRRVPQSSEQPQTQRARTVDFLLTDISPSFQETAERFFGTDPGTFQHIDIV